MAPDEVFEAIRAAVAAGEYADWLPAVPANLAEPGATSTTAPAPNAPGGAYLRGTTEHLQACALGLVAKLPPRPVATPDAVLEVEQAIGCALPPLLRRLFLDVANGGCGPRDGNLLGVRGYNGLADRSTWDDLLDVYRAFRSGPGPHTPRQMLWLYDWGCAIWSLVDCSQPEGHQIASPVR